MTPVELDSFKANAPRPVQLFILDTTNIPGLQANPVYYFTPSSDTPIVWNGNTYQPWPVQITGIEDNSTGDAPARPIITFGNLDQNKLIGMAVFAGSDIVGAKVTYIKTYDTYLNTSLSLPPKKYEVGQKTTHNRQIIAFQLRSPLDSERSFLPHRVMLRKDFAGLSLNKVR